ncbi:hypothetical protein BN137_1660 [Cronobacter condimenti 1330]|uniref:Uncharacterized protein n=1 Tax=Cronobacter condimenti 1330 TaxID=1073999 RepID=K8A0J4_9ENTR|nr:hypothetical protein BN137_1660 [Cronobacter condimenti 1330]
MLYKIKGNSTVTIDFSDIIEIKPGFTKISNRRSVVVVYLLYGQKKEVYFYPNLTFFNHNFAQFLIEVKQANPDADVKSLSRLSR